MPPLPDNVDDPLPLVRITSPVIPTREQLLESERRVLAIINRALDKVGCRPWGTFSCVFQEQVWYRNWCELNHFRPHSPERHLGQIFGDGGRVDPVWPEGPGPKVFAYLKPGHADSLGILKIVIRHGYRVLAYLPGFANDDLKDLLATGRLYPSASPINLANLPDDVEIAIWHSPTGGIARCLDKGMRMVFLPMNSEQSLACVAAKKAGLPVHIYYDLDSAEATFGDIAASPTATLGKRWRPADIPDFAHKLALA